MSPAMKKALNEYFDMQHYKNHSLKNKKFTIDHDNIKSPINKKT